MMKNRIAKLVEIGKVEIFEEEIPLLKEDEILVKTKSAGICGTDLHYFKAGGFGENKPPLPIYLGHEPSGIVVDGKGIKPGLRVAVEPGKSCVSNEWYIKGRHNLGFSSFMGGTRTSRGCFADYMVVDRHQVVEIPDKMSFNLGALMEPLSIALHSIKLVNLNFLDTVLIVGAGPIGLCILHLCKIIGCKKIYVQDHHGYRLRYAEQHGATTRRPSQHISCVFDCAGNGDSLDKCMKHAGIASRVALIGITESEYLHYNPHHGRDKEIVLQNVLRSNMTLHDCIELFSGNQTPESMITHCFELEDIQKAFDITAKRQEKVIKCIINPIVEGHQF